MLGSATSLLVYSLVNFGALRLVQQGGFRRMLIWSSVVACLLAILVWLIYTLKTAPASLSIFFSFLIVSFILEGLLQRYRGKQIRVQED